MLKIFFMKLRLFINEFGMMKWIFMCFFFVKLGIDGYMRGCNSSEINVFVLFFWFCVNGRCISLCGGLSVNLSILVNVCFGIVSLLLGIGSLFLVMWKMFCVVCWLLVGLCSMFWCRW